jgi:tetratricopeptide (TPR) repeat protein
MSQEHEQQSDFEQGQEHLCDGNDDQAEACLNRMLERNPNDPRTIELAGDYAFAMGNYEEADRRYQQLTEVSDDATVLGTSLLSRGLLYEEQDQLDEAKAMFIQATEIFQNLEDHDRSLKCLGHLAEVTMVRGELAESEAALQQARQMLKQDITPQAEDGEVLGLIAQQLGTIAYEQSDLTQAEKWFQEAVDLFRGGEDLMELASSLDSLGAMKQLNGDFEGAESLHLESVQINEAIECGDGLASNYWNLAHLYEHIKEEERAAIYRELATQLDEDEDEDEDEDGEEFEESRE